MRVFISYSHDSDAHRDWVGTLADDLEKYPNYDVVLDQYDLLHTDDKNRFMEAAVSESDFVLVVGTKLYKSKADSRSRGVRYESQLSVQRHLNETDKTGRSKIILLLRESESAPRYLSAKVYIDFTDDAKYDLSFQELLRALAGTGARTRPSKSDRHSNVTRIDDVLKLIYHRRRCIIGTPGEGQDITRGYRIKFELWEVRTPTIAHILVLHNNITLSQTVTRFLELVARMKISLTSLTVLRIDEGPASTELASAITGAHPTLSINHFTLKEFIRDYRIEHQPADTAPVWAEPYFIDQPIYEYAVSGSDKDEPLGSAAITFLEQILTRPTSFAAHLILADGGDGKSALCYELVNSITGQGLGVVWEARIIRQLLYDASAISDKFVPVLFSDASPEQIPMPMKGGTRYVVDTEDGYKDLYRRLTGQPRLLRPALGKIRPLPTRRREWAESPRGITPPPETEEKRWRSPLPWFTSTRVRWLNPPCRSPNGCLHGLIQTV